MKKLFILILTRNENRNNPVANALKVIARSCGYELVESASAAEVILTDSPLKAREFLTEFPAASVVVGLQPWGTSKEELDAHVLEKQNVGRVFVRPLLEGPGEENLVLFLARTATS